MHPKSASLAVASGNSDIGMCSQSQSSASQRRADRSNKAVREAQEWSVWWVRPPVRFQTSQVSTVPQANSPASARSRTSGTFSSSQATLAAEKNESLRRPVRRRNSSSRPARRHRSTIESVCLEIQTRASCTGTPVRRSQIITVSRCEVTATALRSVEAMPVSFRTRLTVESWACHSATGSSSTQPGRGRCQFTAVLASPTMAPSASTTTLRALVEPSSRASR